MAQKLSASVVQTSNATFQVYSKTRKRPKQDVQKPGAAKKKAH